jgi:integrase/recombinase XerC
MQKELDRFLHYLGVEKGYSQGTIEAYRLDIEKGPFPFLHQRGKFGVEEVTKDDIRAYLDYLAVERANPGVTRARKIAAIKSFFNYLVENEGLEASPAASVKSPNVPEKEPVYLSEEECLRFLQMIAQKSKSQVKERDMAIGVLLLHTGLRVSELTNLKSSNVDFERNQIKITRKGDKEQYLHLNGEAVSALANYLNSRPQAQNGRFFVGTKGQNLSRTYVYEVVRRYLKLAGINKGKWGPHLLRHTFCTRLHQKGASPFVIKELAGHKSLNTTMRYMKIENKEQSETLDRLEFGTVNL